MPFLDHLEELRWRIIYSLGSVIVCVGIGFFVTLHYDLVKWLAQKAAGTGEESEAGSGALFSSGLIAGGSLGGLALAVVVGLKKEQIVAVGTRWFPGFAQSDLAALLIFLGLAVVLFFVARSKAPIHN